MYGGVASLSRLRVCLCNSLQTCKKIVIFDLKDQDLLIDLDLLHDLDQFDNLLN